MSELSVGALSGLAANSYVIDVASGSSLDLSNGAVFPSGSVIQVVSTTKTDTFSTSSTSLVDVTGLSASITPRAASSKILILTTVYTSSSTAAQSFALFGLSGGNTSSYTNGGGAAFAGFAATSQNAAWSDTDVRSTCVQGNYLDSPSTTSSITYQVQMQTGGGGTSYVNRYANNGTDFRSVSTITVMEVAG